VPLLAPTSSETRARLVKECAPTRPAGFVYYVSVTGVTGSAAAPLADASREAEKWRAATGLPVVVGFGIDSPEEARAAGAFADGVVVGTAIVREIEDGSSPADRKERVPRLVKSLRLGLDA